MLSVYARNEKLNCELEFKISILEQKQEIDVYLPENSGPNNSDQPIRLGAFTVEKAFNDVYWLKVVWVDEDYQRKGIGTQIIECARDYLKKWKIACIEAARDCYGLTAEGQELIAYCIKRQIIAADRCVLVQDLPIAMIQENTWSYEEGSGAKPTKLVIDAIENVKKKSKRELQIIGTKTSFFAKPHTNDCGNAKSNSSVINIKSQQKDLQRKVGKKSKRATDEEKEKLLHRHKKFKL